MQHIPTPSGHQPIRLGQLDMLVVTDGVDYYPSEDFAPGVAREAVQQVLHDHFIYTDTFVLPHNILVIQHNDRTILFDAGNGSANGPDCGHLPANLLLAGIAPESVTDIILSHAHSDHVGGLFNTQGQAIYPKATIHVSQAEYDGWMRDDTDLFSNKIPREAVLGMQQRIRQCFARAAAQLQLFDSATPLFGFIQPIPAPGHTPGHSMFQINSGTETLLHIADIVHDEALLLAKPEWGNLFDTDFALAAATRRRVLEEAATSRQRVFGYHLPWPGVGHIRRQGEGFAWVPTRCATPQLPLIL